MAPLGELQYFCLMFFVDISTVITSVTLCKHLLMNGKNSSFVSVFFWWVSGKHWAGPQPFSSFVPVSCHRHWVYNSVETLTFWSKFRGFIKMLHCPKYWKNFSFHQKVEATFLDYSRFSDTYSCRTWALPVSQSQRCSLDESAKYQYHHSMQLLQIWEQQINLMDIRVW